MYLYVLPPSPPPPHSKKREVDLIWPIFSPQGEKNSILLDFPKNMPEPISTPGWTEDRQGQQSFASKEKT